MEEVRRLGRYEVLAVLGRGAMGVVYKAADPVLNRIVAIKTINLALDPDDRGEYEARFQQEAKAAGSLSHPAIVTIFDMGQNGNLAFMAMEFLDGRELRELIAATGRLPVKQAISVAAEVANALAYAHQRGIVHRDIKPANIMVLHDGGVKITDFGIARMRVSTIKTQTGMRLGSPRYMSPEQVLGQRVDHRTDIFSLGVVLYEMLTGNPPFVGNSVETLMYQTVHTLALAPSRINPVVPEILDLIVAKMLEKRPEDRYQDAAALASDLRECEGHCAAALSAAGNLGVATGLHELPPDMLAIDRTLILPVDSRSRRSAQVNPVPVPDRLDVVDELEVGSLGLSNVVDSMSATQRLAQEIGVHNEFAKYAASHGFTRVTDARNTAAAVASAAAPTAGSAGGGIPAWSPQEIRVSVAILLFALIVATLIVLL